MESIIREEIIEHMKKHNLFSDKQYGFITGRSTSLQLLKVLDIWTHILDSGGQIDVMYMDFMKTFDQVPHRRLIGKVESYGIGGDIIGWISDFLRANTTGVNKRTPFNHRARDKRHTPGKRAGTSPVRPIHQRPARCREQLCLPIRR